MEVEVWMTSRAVSVEEAEGVETLLEWVPKVSWEAMLVAELVVRHEQMAYPGMVTEELVHVVVLEGLEGA